MMVEKELDNTEHIRDLFNAIALQNEDKLSAMMGWHIYNDYDKLRIQHLFEKIEYDGHGKTLLDAGCGIGRNVDLFEKLGFKVVGIDLSEANINICKSQHPNAEFFIGDIKDLSRFKDGSFDCVTCLHVLTHVASDTNAQKAVSEFERVSAGKVIIGGAMERRSPESLGGKLRLVDDYEKMFKKKVCEEKFIDWSVFSQVEYSTKVGPIHRVSYLVMK